MAPKRSVPQASAAPDPVTEEVYFPRGGGHSLSALEAKQLRAEGAAQARADASFNGKRSKKARTDGDADLVGACMRACVMRVSVGSDSLHISRQAALSGYLCGSELSEILCEPWMLLSPSSLHYMQVLLSTVC